MQWVKIGFKTHVLGQLDPKFVHSHLEFLVYQLLILILPIIIIIITNQLITFTKRVFQAGLINALRSDSFGNSQKLSLTD